MKNLTLTRRQGESIMIGDSVEVVIVSIKGGKVRLGFKAKSDIPVHRKEIYDNIQKEQSLQ